LGIFIDFGLFVFLGVLEVFVFKCFPTVFRDGSSEIESYSVLSVFPKKHELKIFLIF
jgi:hypothetical protein